MIEEETIGIFLLFVGIFIAGTLIFAGYRI